MVRRRLVKFFEWQNCISPEDQADKTIDIVARKIDEGEQIEKLVAYFFGVARFVFKEYLRKREREMRAYAALPASSEDVGGADEAEESRRACSKKCFKDLPDSDRDLMIAYCKPDGRPRKERKQELADRLGITIENLRLRVCRIRKRLNACVERCQKEGLAG
jgi:DNA-directed RNA polymerase specialized sigma24 family protein